MFLIEQRVLYAAVRFDVRRHVFASRDFKENEKNQP